MVDGFVEVAPTHSGDHARTIAPAPGQQVDKTVRTPTGGTPPDTGVRETQTAAQTCSPQGNWRAPPPAYHEFATMGVDSLPRGSEFIRAFVMRLPESFRPIGSAQKPKGALTL